jgi:hypothetical protein
MSAARTQPKRLAKRIPNVDGIARRKRAWQRLLSPHQHPHWHPHQPPMRLLLYARISISENLVAKRIPNADGMQRRKRAWQRLLSSHPHPHWHPHQQPHLHPHQHHLHSFAVISAKKSLAQHIQNANGWLQTINAHDLESGAMSRPRPTTTLWWLNSLPILLQLFPAKCSKHPRCAATP